jgi:hypothetical protein
MTEKSGFKSWMKQRDLSYPVSRLPLGPTELPIQWVPDALSMEIKCLEYKADNASASHTEKMHGEMPPLLHGMVLN